MISVGDFMCMYPFLSAFADDLFTRVFVGKYFGVFASP